ncbi:MAG: tetratricopeptide repeat protein [bacterium]|nr:tetratricopeptide repeat protein [bacterium]
MHAWQRERKALKPDSKCAVDADAPGHTHRRLVLVAAAVFVAGAVLATHWPVLSAQALSFDDGQFLTDNPLVRNPSWTSAGRFFGEVLEPSTVDGYYLPLSMVSLMLDYAAGGRPENLRPFHRTSLALHVANTVLIMVLLYSLFGQAVPAALVSLLFGVHPLTVEPVAWIGERKTLLAAFFALWCMILFVRYARRGGRTWLLAALVMYLLAVMSKPTAVPLVVLLLLIDHWPLRRLTLRTTIEKAPFFLLAGISAIITWISHSQTAGIQVPGQDSPLRVPLTMCHLIVFYLHKIVWPAHLTSAYPLPEPLSMSNPTVVLGVIGTVILVVLLVLSLRWTRALLTGWLIFLVAILPTLGLVQYSWVTASDKYVYLPSIGVLLILAWLMRWVWSVGAGASRPVVRRGGVLLLIVLLAAAETLGTQHYLRRWQDTEGLFRHMIRFAPRALMPHYDLAHCLQSQGRLAEAKEEYGTALRINPFHADSHNNLGLVLSREGQVEDAVLHYEQALRANPDYAAVLVNLGNALVLVDRLDEAMVHHNKARGIAPNDPRTHNALGSTLFRRSKLDQAVGSFREALRLDVQYAEAYKNLGQALAAQEDLEGAMESYQQALELDPRDADVLNNYGVVLFRTGDVEGAIAAYRRALRVNPGHEDSIGNLTGVLLRLGKIDQATREAQAFVATNPRQSRVWNNLGDLLFEQEKLIEAADAYRAAVQGDPDNAEAHANLGVTLAMRGKFADAVREYRVVLRLHPRDASTHNNLGAALMELGQLEESVAHFRTAVQLKPDYAAAHYNLGCALAALGRSVEAGEAFRAALRIDPSDRTAREQLEAIEASQRKNASE